MTKKPDAIQPQPYHNLDPARAAAKLGPQVDTTRFAKAAAFCAKGRDDLAKRGYSPDGKKRLRRFSIWEITKYLLPVAPAHLRRVLRAPPGLGAGVEVQDAAGLLIVLDAGFRAQVFQRVAAVVAQRHQLADVVAQPRRRALAQKGQTPAPLLPVGAQPE